MRLDWLLLFLPSLLQHLIEQQVVLFVSYAAIQVPPCEICVQLHWSQFHRTVLQLQEEVVGLATQLA